ncbi:MAG: hypothetical protein IJW90_05970 [Clostridia bacterium]|nr:hypothetical protein [Clostridia bacterium]
MKIQRTHLLKRLDTLYMSYNTSFGNWKYHDHYVNLQGPRGSGKTTLILEWLEQHTQVYFSFAGLDEPMALRLLSAKLQTYMDEQKLPVRPMDSWEDVFLNINTLSEHTCHIFVFDDADEMLRNEVFSAAFQAYFANQKRRAILMIFVTRAEKVFEFPPNYTGWMENEIPIDVPYFSIADLCKYFPAKKGDDLLALYALTGGIPALVSLIDGNTDTESTLRRLLSPGSANTAPRAPTARQNRATLTPIQSHLKRKGEPHLESGRCPTPAETFPPPQRRGAQAQWKRSLWESVGGLQGWNDEIHPNLAGGKITSLFRGAWLSIPIPNNLPALLTDILFRPLVSVIGLR